MKIFKNLLAVIIFAIVLNYSTNAAETGVTIIGASRGDNLQKIGAAGSQFLKIGVGARASGMSAYGAVSNDLSAIFWNPAGLTGITGSDVNVSVNYTSWFGGFTHNFAAASYRLSDDYVIAASVTSFGVNDIQITTVQNPEGTGSSYSVNDFSGGVTLAGNLTEKFSFGITGKYVRNAFSTLSAGTFAFDIGTMYQTGIENIKLGFSIHNLGTEMQMGGQALNAADKLYNDLNNAPIDFQYVSYPYLIPLMFRAGISSDLYQDETNKLIGAIDFVTLSDTPEQFVFGAEYTYDNLVSFRAGYTVGHDNSGLSAGIGLKYVSGSQNASFDYSINPSRVEGFGLINRIGINVGM
ncbi:MAG: PorV/PorQ family protein [Candidatus Kapaibacteriota bacterium]|jgi:hypothetical protein